MLIALLTDDAQNVSQMLKWWFQRQERTTAAAAAAKKFEAATGKLMWKGAQQAVGTVLSCGIPTAAKSSVIVSGPHTNKGLISVWAPPQLQLQADTSASTSSLANVNSSAGSGSNAGSNGGSNGTPAAPAVVLALATGMWYEQQHMSCTWVASDAALLGVSPRVSMCAAGKGGSASERLAVEFSFGSPE